MNRSSCERAPVAAFLIWLLLVLGCWGGGGGPSYVSTERWGCVTPDGSKIGLANRTVTAVIDARSGQLLRSEKTENEGGVVCLGSNKVIAIYPQTAIDLTGDERRQRNGKTFTIVGAAGDEGIVHYAGGKLASSKSSSSSPLEVCLEKFGSVNIKPQLIEVPFAKFKGLTTGSSSYWVIPVRVLSDGRLLVAAGNRPGHSSGTSQKTTVSSAPWGFFTVVPAAGEVENYGSVKTQNPEINFVYVPKTYATPDGKFTALASSFGDSKSFAVWSSSSAAGGDEEIFRKSVPEASEILDVIVSGDGTRAAILIRFQNEYRIKAYDVAGKAEINNFLFSQSSTQFLDLTAGGELTLSDYYGSASRIDVRTGQKIWEWKFPPSK